ncbi:unnamed protein product [Rotaria sordida]|uniref:Cupin type-2 domain-containing protein n=1 Tax=Rotaria sordida TaxID=392033 RepID=A0A815MX70_9BILA|nr:unnamed protein product [Rotaria sordida]CAF1429199.1 unnamed protein product [Rotaria sordida]
MHINVFCIAVFFILAIDLIQSQSYTAVQPGGGQRVHALPFQNGFYRIILRGNQTNKQFTIIEGVVYMNEGARLHYHMFEDEMFFVTNGTLQFYVDGDQFCAKAGTTVYIPRNITQSIRNINSKPVHVQILFAPSGRENFLEEVSIINDNPPINATLANQLALRYGQVNLGEVSSWKDLNCVHDSSTLLKLSFYLMFSMFLSLIFNADFF